MKKVLLDENLRRQLNRLFSTSLEVNFVPGLGWQSKKNGELLLAMSENGFDILLTADRNFQFQQNISKHGLKPLVSHIEKMILESDDKSCGS